MAPANAKPWKQQALILMAALLLGAASGDPAPGSDLPLGACSAGLEQLRSLDRSCFRTVVLRATSEEDVRKCCGRLGDVISESSGDCACDLVKAFEERNIDVATVCELGMTKEECQAK
ncbi:hypothetical protein SEVIR_2G344100v4 [Setaria viridis]|uniref:Bifunctional inhibitor/plant lipid transfer protein/seed storage helical domain-containing protein n=1 Tax=Setaria viridis TaxID=4556 RepID=A0A4U6W174_SETVI|nr:hypothetical protein SEVIR_2G344100v2 [Setaria viridis]